MGGNSKTAKKKLKAAADVTKISTKLGKVIKQLRTLSAFVQVMWEYCFSRARTLRVAVAVSIVVLTTFMMTTACLTLETRGRGDSATRTQQTQSMKARCKYHYRQIKTIKI